jgi:hypothetical protein
MLYRKLFIFIVFNILLHLIYFAASDSDALLKNLEMCVEKICVT